MNNKTKAKNGLTLPIIKKTATIDIIRTVNGKKRITTYTKDEYLLYLDKENERLNNVINELEKDIIELMKSYKDVNAPRYDMCKHFIYKIQELKEGDKDE